MTAPAAPAGEVYNSFLSSGLESKAGFLAHLVEHSLRMIPMKNARGTAFESPEIHISTFFEGRE